MFALGLLGSLVIFRQITNHVYQPKNSVSTYMDKRQRPIQYQGLKEKNLEKLCVSAVMARLAYMPLQDFNATSIDIVKDNSNLKTSIKSALLEDMNAITLFKGNDVENHVYHDTQVFVWTKDQQ